MRFAILLIIFLVGFLRASTSTNRVYLQHIKEQFDLAEVPEQCDDEFLTFTNHTDKLIIRKFSRKMYINNTLYWLSDGFSMEPSNDWYFAEHDYNRFLLPLLITNGVENVDDDFVVFIDPGHGGVDCGAYNVANTNLHEADIVFNVATNLARLLRESGMTVYLSRTNDTYVGLTERSEMANEYNADLFISIHVNSSSSPHAKGFETFTLPLGNCHSTSGNSAPKYYEGNNYDLYNSLLGYRIQNALIGAFPENFDRGVKHARYQVLKNLKCPAVLVECGFISNNEERKKLSLNDYQLKLSETLMQGIMNYRSTIDDVLYYVLNNKIETLVYIEKKKTDETPDLFTNQPSLTEAKSDTDNEKRTELSYEFLNYSFNAEAQPLLEQTNTNNVNSVNTNANVVWTSTGTPSI